MAGKRFWICIFILSIIAVSCSGPKSRLDVDVSGVRVEPVKIKRYGQALFQADPNNLKQELIVLQPQFPVFLEGDLNDTINLYRIYEFITDTMLQSVYKDCNNNFPTLEPIEDQLTEAFKHFTYYFPERQLPEVYSYISGFDFEYPVGYTENALLIALDMYLGPDYPRYKRLGAPLYLIRNFDADYIVRDCMEQMATAQIDPRKVKNELLNRMVSEGKILYFIQAMKPDLPDTIILKYSKSQMDWVKQSEGAVWAFIIENKLLYVTDLQTFQKFILDAPFSSYFGSESPPRLGWWIGWQIVKNYMDRNPEFTLKDLMNEYDAQKLLTGSGYKPRIN
jgi:hypothetical protein